LIFALVRLLDPIVQGHRHLLSPCLVQTPQLALQQSMPLVQTFLPHETLIPSCGRANTVEAGRRRQREVMVTRRRIVIVVG